MTIDQTAAEITADIKAGTLTQDILRMHLFAMEMQIRRDQINRDLTAALKIIGGDNATSR